MNRKLLRRILEGGKETFLVGAKLEEADDGRSAVEAVRRGEEQGTPFSVILMDCNMVIVNALPRHI
jgi:CheY-like chemotaxis protein